MRNTYTPEIVFLVLVIALSLAGFSGLYLGDRARPDGYQHLHVVTSLAWLLLLLSQLVLIRTRRFAQHRLVGRSIFFAGPLLVGTLTLLSVHSAAKDAALGRADFMVVQNVMTTLEVALLIFLAFVLRKNRGVHGALLMGTALLFMGVALFFTLIGFVPQFRIEGPGTFHRFAEAGQLGAWVVAAVGLLFFLKDWRTGWPWLLAGAFFLVNGFVQMLVARADETKSLTRLVAAIGEAPAFGLGLTVFLSLLGMAWRIAPSRRSLPSPEAARNPSLQSRS